jgi:hypothetical protein
MDKDFIISEIKRVSANDKAVGVQKFEKETGIQKTDWYGKYWIRWSDALKEAGLVANEFNKAFTDAFVIEKLVSLIRELKHYPVSGEIRMKARKDEAFPAHNVFNRVGNKESLISKVLQFCDEKEEYADIIEACKSARGYRVLAEDEKKEKENTIEFVYLIKSGKFYKIGRSNSVGRRQYELSIQLPESSAIIHKISTDDAVGIEAYWHNRFRDKRKNGEWFELMQADIKIFKRRKFM